MVAVLARVPRGHLTEGFHPMAMSGNSFHNVTVALHAVKPSVSFANEETAQYRDDLAAWCALVHAVADAFYGPNPSVSAGPLADRGRFYTAAGMASA